MRKSFVSILASLVLVGGGLGQSAEAATLNLNVVVGGFTPAANTALVSWYNKQARAKANSGSTTTRFGASAWCRDNGGSRKWLYGQNVVGINMGTSTKDCANDPQYFVALDNNWALQHTA